MIVLNGNVEVLSNVLDFTVCHIIILIVIVVIVRDVVYDVSCVARLTVLSSVAVTLWFTFITELASFLNGFAFWVDSSSSQLDALSRFAFLAQTWLILC